MCQREDAQWIEYLRIGKNCIEGMKKGGGGGDGSQKKGETPTEPNEDAMKLQRL